MTHRAFILSSVIVDVENGETLKLPSAIAHRFKNVLRLKEGAQVELFDGTGKVVRGNLRFGDPVKLENIDIKIVDNVETPLWIAQALVKTDKLEQVVQRSTELGAFGLLLFEAERSTSRLTDKTAQKQERFMRIAQDAARQCGREHVPEIIGPVEFSTLNQFCQEFPGLVVAGKIGSSERLSRVLEQHRKKSEQGILFVIGPEGDLSTNEFETLKKYGAVFASWAPHVLRTETAALAAISVAQVFFGRA